jgi:hypothetical protein
MASAKQIAANRLNALHSIGPRTEEGKQIVSQNAVTHGLTGQHIVRRGDQNEAFAAFFDSMLPDFAPSTTLELDFARRIHPRFLASQPRRSHERESPLRRPMRGQSLHQL